MRRRLDDTLEALFAERSHLTAAQAAQARTLFGRVVLEDFGGLESFCSAVVGYVAAEREDHTEELAQLRETVEYYEENIAAWNKADESAGDGDVEDLVDEALRLERIRRKALARLEDSGLVDGDGDLLGAIGQTLELMASLRTELDNAIAADRGPRTL